MKARLYRARCDYGWFRDFGDSWLRATLRASKRLWQR